MRTKEQGEYGIKLNESDAIEDNAVVLWKGNFLLLRSFQILFRKHSYQFANSVVARIICDTWKVKLLWWMDTMLLWIMHKTYILCVFNLQLRDNSKFTLNSIDTFTKHLFRSHVSDQNEKCIRINRDQFVISPLKYWRRP